MQLALTDQQSIMVETLDRFFAEESSIPRVRASEEQGFDPKLWRELGNLGALAMRSPGDDGMGLFDAALVMEQAGRHIINAPLAEGMLSVRLLTLLNGPEDLIAGVSEGERVVTLALKEVLANETQIVPAAGVADAIIFLTGDEVRFTTAASNGDVPLSHASTPLKRMALMGQGAPASIVLAQGKEACELFLATIEEWKILTAAAVTAMGRRGLEIAADYAKEREQFGRPIGSFQAIAHPLADRISDMEGAKLLVWDAVRKIADDDADAAAAVSKAWYFAAVSAGQAVQRALHSFGGYGLTNEYDIQLYHRRAKATALLLGDPSAELMRAGARQWLGEEVPLPDAGPVEIEFGLGAEAEALAKETREFFENNLTPEWHAKSHYSYDGHDWDLNKKVGAARLLFPTWPKEHGGRDGDGYVGFATLSVWDELDITTHAKSVSDMVGQIIIEFGSERVKKDVLPRIANGEIIMCLGYSEPSSGSDVFAARTRAVRDGDDWVINGQKIFTSGANLASHVFLLTRTNPDAPKHKGLTMFLVPLDSPGVEIQPIFTFQEERTNQTFYSDVRVSDEYRMGPVDGGLEVLAYALTLEHGGSGFVGPHTRVVEAAVDWARNTRRDNRPVIEDPRVLERLARASTHAMASRLIYYRCLWSRESGKKDRALGPMSKLFSSEMFLRDATDLFDLTAPDSLIRGKHNLGFVELSHRHASATTIYGGTSEVHRSQVAENALGLPKSR